MNNKENKSLDCDIVCDLLPLYHDGVVSDTTAVAVDEHLGWCEKCSKEYDDLRAEMPETSKLSTKENFNNMMKKKRIKQKIIILFACVLSCLILASGYYVLTEVPLVNIKDVTVHRVYRYNTQEGDKFFLLYSTKNMSACSPEMKVNEQGGKTVYEFNWKRPIIAKDDDGATVHITSISANYLNNEKTQKSDCDILNYGGNVVWTKENNSDDLIPEYVYGYDLFENSNSDEFEDSDAASWYCNIDAENIESEQNYLGIQHAAYGTVHWNIDGEVIYDSGDAQSKMPLGNE